MNKKLPELLIIFALFISPLLHSSIENSFQTRRMWSWCLLISVAIITFFATYPFRVQKIFSYLGIALGAIFFSSFIFAIYPVHAIAIYLVTLALLTCFAVYIITKNNSQNILIFTIVLLGCFCLYAQWGIGQFIFQHDLGMYRLGESILNQNTPGVASFYIGSDKFIRSYGPFAHANSLGGVLLLGIVLLYKNLKKLRSSIFTQSLFFILSLGIITSFSRTALIGLAFVSLLFFLRKKSLLLIPIVISGLLFTPLFLHRSLDINSVAAHDRIEGLTWFRGMANTEILTRGMGLGNYTSSLTTYLQINNITHQVWDRAPIHSVPLFIIAELGLLISLPIFIFVTRFLYSNKLWVFAAIIPALLLDHYFATQVAPAIFLITSAHLVVQ